MIVGLFAKIHRTDFSREFQEVIDWLESNGCEALVETEVAKAFGLQGTRAVAPTEIPKRADVIVVFGGDGTMLSVARLVCGYECPILGANLGSLGFLTEVTLDHLYNDLTALLEGNYQVESRCMLQAQVIRPDGSEETFHALNDVVVNKAALARVITVDAYFNGHFIAGFVADGLIVSTPTGSTAYNLSAGGPIVYPSLESILITPICPHTLTNRPLIVPPSAKVRFVLRSGKDVMITVDGQIGIEFKEGDVVVCKQSPYKTKLIRSGEKSFFDVLREKLKWAKR